MDMHEICVQNFSFPIRPRYNTLSTCDHMATHFLIRKTTFRLLLKRKHIMLPPGQPPPLTKSPPSGRSIGPARSYAFVQKATDRTKKKKTSPVPRIVIESFSPRTVSGLI